MRRGGDWKMVAMKRSKKTVTRTEAATSMIDVKMLELLACPLTKGPLVWDAAKSELVSRLAKLAYPVRDGIPVMLPSEARVIEPE